MKEIDFLIRLYRKLEDSKLPLECFPGGPNTSIITWNPLFSGDESDVYQTSTVLYPGRIEVSDIGVKMVRFGVGKRVKTVLETHKSSLSELLELDGESFGYLIILRDRPEIKYEFGTSDFKTISTFSTRNYTDHETIFSVCANRRLPNNWKDISEGDNYFHTMEKIFGYRGPITEFNIRK